MDVRDDATAGDGGLDQGVQLLVSSDGQLQVAGGDTLHFQILGGVARQLKNFSSQVFCKNTSTKLIKASNQPLFCQID